MSAQEHSGPLVSIGIPIYNEGRFLEQSLASILAQDYKNLEIIISDNASTDNSGELCQKFVDDKDARISCSRFGQNHGVTENFRRVLDFANGLYNRLASWMTGQQVKDLTSGFWATRADKFKEFLYLLPNGFSYQTTITMAFFRSGYSVSYVPIHAAKRLGKSHIKPFKDSVRFLLIIFKIGTLYSPLKLFLPISTAFFVTGVLYYLYTFMTEHRFTNMSALLLITSILVLLIGLVSEQITTLNYKDNKTGT